MLLIVTGIASLALWVILWGIGAKALDAAMLCLLIMISAAAAHIVIPMLPGNRRRSDD